MYHLRTPLFDLNFTGTVSKSLIIVENRTQHSKKYWQKECNMKYTLYKTM